jgi:hypothetical protein
MRRKSRTSAWRRSISSTKTTSETPSRAYKSLFEAAAADTAAEAARAEAAAAAFEAAGAAFEAAALAFEAAEAAALAFEAAAGEAAAAVAAGAAGAGAGAAVAACRGEVAPSASLERLAIKLEDARGSCPGLTRFDSAKDFLCGASLEHGRAQAWRWSLAPASGAGAKVHVLTS